MYIDAYKQHEICDCIKMQIFFIRIGVYAQTVRGTKLAVRNIPNIGESKSQDIDCSLSLSINLCDVKKY